MSAITVQIRQKGVITLPVELRRQYDWKEGDILTLIDLGDGSLLLFPRIFQVAHQGDQVVRILEEEGVKLEDILETLDQERQDYYQEHYVKP